jgi:hypothetical protein
MIATRWGLNSKRTAFLLITAGWMAVAWATAMAQATGTANNGTGTAYVPTMTFDVASIRLSGTTAGSYPA